MKLNQLFLFGLELLLLSWLDLRLAHGSRFQASLSVSHRTASFSLSSGRSAATLVACLDIDITYLIPDMQFARCSADVSQTELRPLAKAFLMFRQPPALPCRLQHSTIGRLGLNHRVRDGNGCDPQAHRHRKYSVVFTTYGLKWTRTTDLTLIRRAL